MRVSKVVVLALILVMVSGVALAQQPDSAASSGNSMLTLSQVLDRVMEREKATVKAMQQYHPMVETYLQTTRPEEDMSGAPASDLYYLGRLDLSDSMQERFYVDFEEVGWGSQILHKLPNHTRKFFTMDYVAVGFTAMIFPDARGISRETYSFEFLRREFLGDVRCLVFQMVPKDNSGRGRFLGQIWVEDKEFNIVRFNGVYTHAASHGEIYLHMDSWRSNLQPGLWLPSHVYSEESGERQGPKKAIRYKAQTRLWAYDLKHAGRQEEFTQMLVEQGGNAVKDESESAADSSPQMSLRKWQREAEDNVLDRLERAGLLAPAGPVDAVLTTVVNNLEITNNLDIQPEVRCRVLLTVPLESFTVGHTIIISRGLLDVLPDEASLAMVLSHELAHIAREDYFDTRYAFGDRMWTADEDSFRNFHFQHSPANEQLADKRALELLKNSPYKDKLAGAGLFLRQLAQLAPSIPSLTRARLGDGLTNGATVTRFPEIMNSAPALEQLKLDQIAALPLGGRIKVDPWTGGVDLMKTKPVRIRSAREKMPFEVTPMVPRLTRYANGVSGSTGGNTTEGAGGGTTEGSRGSTTEAVGTESTKGNTISATSGPGN